MGDVMNGCTFPGRMISWAGVVRSGSTTDTAVRATCDVSVRNFAFALTRDQIPDATSATVTISAIDPTSHGLCECVAPLTLFISGECPPISFTSSFLGDIVAPYSAYR